MSEYRDYIVRISADGESPREKLVEIVRCRDCKYGINDGELCSEDASDSWDWRSVEPDGFCAWGERREA